MEEKIKARIVKLLNERQEFISKAERTISNYDVVIGELQNLLKSPETTDDSTNVPLT